MAASAVGCGSVRLSPDAPYIPSPKGRGFTALLIISKKKKGALGMAGMNLAADDVIRAVYLYGGDYSDGDSIMYKDKELAFGRLKINHRNAKGSKVRR